MRRIAPVISTALDDRKTPLDVLTELVEVPVVSVRSDCVKSLGNRNTTH